MVNVVKQWFNHLTRWKCNNLSARHGFGDFERIVPPINYAGKKKKKTQLGSRRILSHCSESQGHHSLDGTQICCPATDAPLYTGFNSHSNPGVDILIVFQENLAFRRKNRTQYVKHVSLCLCVCVIKHEVVKLINRSMTILELGGSCRYIKIVFQLFPSLLFVKRLLFFPSSFE